MKRINIRFFLLPTTVQNRFIVTGHLPLVRNFDCLIGSSGNGDSAVGNEIGLKKRFCLPDRGALSDLTDRLPFGFSRQLATRQLKSLESRLPILNIGHFIKRAFFKYKTQEHQRLLHINARYNKSDRLVALARFYDLATGVTTTRPENIDGNWDAALSIAYTQGLGKDDRWTLQGEAGGTFLHSVDFATDNPSAALPDRVAVDNLSIDAMLRADYRFEKWTAGAKATMKHTRLTGGGPAFTPFHYTDAAFGLTLTAPLPGGIDLETDLMAYLRRGYADASMNTTDWVWNASLSKAFGKRKQWLLRAVGFERGTTPRPHTPPST